MVDRRLLSGLEWPAWDSAATELQGQLTDAVIDGAVRQLPPEFQERNAAWLASALKQRRDQLPAEARKFYELLASEAEVTGSDEAERVEVDRPGDRVLDLTIRPAKGDDAAPVYHRRFDRDDTREVRLYLNGGDDAVVIRGTGGGAPLLRVIGGGGDDRVTDSSTRRAGEVLRRAGVQRGRRTASSAARHAAVPGFPAHRFNPLSGARLGRVLALPSLDQLRTGRRLLLRRRRRALQLRLPQAALWPRSWTFRAGYATGAERFRADFLGEFHRVNSRVKPSIFLRASGIEVVRFFGFGNETQRVGDDEFYRVPQQQYLVAPAVTFPVGSFGAFSVGPDPQVRKHGTANRVGSSTSTRCSGRATFGEVGAIAGFEWDTRDGPVATRGAHFTAGGTRVSRALGRGGHLRRAPR